MTKEDFFNQYEIDISEGRLGGGAFGTVYKAYDNVNSLWKAVKIAEVKYIGAKSFSLISEFNATKNLRPHKNIANYESVHQFQMPNGLFDYAVMQYYAEGNLKDLIRKGGLTLAQKVQIAHGIISGIHYLHQHAVIHRDLKPSNILISQRKNEYIPKIADFGLSKLVSEAGLSAITNSFGGGTLEYSSPEQLVGKSLKYNSDLWSVGVLIFELFSGKIPFDSDSFVGSDAARRAQIYQNINEVKIQGDLSKFPSPFNEIISRTLVRDPANRIQNSNEIISILDPERAEKEVGLQVIGLEKNKEPIVDDETIVLDREEIARKLEEEKSLLKLKILEEQRANELAKQQAAKEKERRKDQETKLKKEEEDRRRKEEKAKREEEERFQKELEAKRLAEEKQKQKDLEEKKLALLKQKEEAERRNKEEERRRKEEQAKREEEERFQKELEAKRLAEEKQKQKIQEEERIALLKQKEEEAKRKKEEDRRREEEKAKREEELRRQNELEAKRLAEEKQKQKKILLEKKKKQEEQKIKADRLKAERQAEVLREKAEKRLQRRKERREQWLKFKPSLIKTTKRAALALLLLIPLFFTARYANSYYKSIPKPYTSGELQGYANNDGVVIVEAEFDAVSAFKNGKGVAFRGDSTFVFNKNGVLIQSKIIESTDFQEGVVSQENTKLEEAEDLSATNPVASVQPSNTDEVRENNTSNTRKGEKNQELNESKLNEPKSNASDEIASIENKSENIEENEGGQTNILTDDIPGQDEISKNEIKPRKDNSIMSKEPIRKGVLIPEFSPVKKIEGDDKEVSLVEKTPIVSSYLIAIEENLVKIKGSPFKMGCDGKDQDCQKDESPSFTAKLGNYYMSKYEVTQKEFQEIMAYNPSYNAGCPNCPVENVSYSEVMEYIARLNKLEGNKFKYRLPTEKEWEYAALGGKDYIYAGSNDAAAVAEYKSTNGMAAIEVGKTKKNNYGLSGMSGNVAEWCSDWYDKNTYSNDKAPQSGSLKVVRGGSWNDRKRIVRIKNRGRENPDTKKPTIGFRLVREEL